MIVWVFRPRRRPDRPNPNNTKTFGGHVQRCRPTGQRHTMLSLFSSRRARKKSRESFPFKQSALPDLIPMFPRSTLQPALVVLERGVADPGSPLHCPHYFPRVSAETEARPLHRGGAKVWGATIFSLWSSWANRRFRAGRRLYARLACSAPRKTRGQSRTAVPTGHLHRPPKITNGTTPTKATRTAHTPGGEAFLVSLGGFGHRRNGARRLNPC